MLCFFGVMRVRIPSKHDGPSGHMRKNWVPEWEQSTVGGMSRPETALYAYQAGFTAALDLCIEIETRLNKEETDDHAA